MTFCDRPRSEIPRPCGGREQGPGGLDCASLGGHLCGLRTESQGKNRPCVYSERSPSRALWDCDICASGGNRIFTLEATFHSSGRSALLEESETRSRVKEEVLRDPWLPTSWRKGRGRTGGQWDKSGRHTGCTCPPSLSTRQGAWTLVKQAEIHEGTRIRLRGLDSR